MTPKEEAEELIKEMYNNNLSFELAKKSAIILIDKILNEHRLFPYNTVFYERQEYWKQVKYEIEIYENTLL